MKITRTVPLMGRYSPFKGREEKNWFFLANYIPTCLKIKNILELIYKIQNT